MLYVSYETTKDNILSSCLITAKLTLAFCAHPIDTKLILCPGGRLVLAQRASAGLSMLSPEPGKSLWL